MMEDKTAFSEREEIEMLLPWYVGGTLDATDRGRVERYLARHPEIWGQLELIREERQETVIANEALPTSPARALDRLMAALPARRQGFLQRFSHTEIYQAVSVFFSSPTPRGVRWAAAAAAVLLLVQAAAITALIVHSDGGAYETAAGSDSRDGLSFFVSFNDNASASAISQLLAEYDARIVDGPKPGAVYRVQVRTSDRSQSAEDALLRRLSQRNDLVRRVFPAKD